MEIVFFFFFFAVELMEIVYEKSVSCFQLVFLNTQE